MEGVTFYFRLYSDLLYVLHERGISYLAQVGSVGSFNGLWQGLKKIVDLKFHGSLQIKWDQYVLGLKHCDFELTLNKIDYCGPRMKSLEK